MNDLHFDSAYYGADPDLSRKSGYDDYADLISEKAFLKRAEKIFPEVSGSILELGCGYGTHTKLAKENNLNWRGLDSSKWCMKNKVCNIIYEDALEYLQSYKLKYDFIVSFNFLECNSDEYLGALRDFMNKVSKKQIHYTAKNPNPKFYNQNIKSIFNEVRYFS